MFQRHPASGRRGGPTLACDSGDAEALAVRPRLPPRDEPFSALDALTRGTLRDDLLAARHASDLGSPALAQLVLADLMSSGVLERHLRTVRRRQRARRDALVAALASEED